MVEIVSLLLDSRNLDQFDAAIASLFFIIQGRGLTSAGQSERMGDFIVKPALNLRDSMDQPDDHISKS